MHHACARGRWDSFRAEPPIELGETQLLPASGGISAIAPLSEAKISFGVRP